jgi:hypothetical protein
MHESSVNYQNLIRDLAEMYPFEVAEVVLVELVANSLDAKSDYISVDFDPHKKVLTVKDNGRGMNASEFEEYHDFAAGLKARGTGIGFAGLGAKISFNIADRVITETRSKSFSGGSNWYLQSKKRLIWEDIPPTHQRDYGTTVKVWFKSDAKFLYSCREDLIRLLKRHYLPLFDLKFLQLYRDIGIYHGNLKFEVNGKLVKPGSVINDFILDKVKEFFPMRGSKKFGYGLFGLAKSEYPIGLDVCGVLLCTHGKVIKLDFFNQFPGGLGSRIFGLVEVPEFVNYLTTAKTDFIHKGKHRDFESLYNPIRQEFKVWLKDIGVEIPEKIDTDEALKLEKELRKLVEEVPELGEFFGFRARKSIPQPSGSGTITAAPHNGTEVTFPANGQGGGKGEFGPLDVGNHQGQTLVEDQKTGTIKAIPIGRTAKRGPKIAFLEVPDKTDLSWVDGNNIVINSGHPAYIKAQSSAVRRIHCLFSIANAVQRFLHTQRETSDLMFIDRMMSVWGRK